LKLLAFYGVLERGDGAALVRVLQKTILENNENTAQLYPM